MLKKIISISNVGRFVSSALPGTPPCAKYTQIFGANGYGKTTICAILRSLSANNPALIAGRARIGSKKAPEIELLFEDKVVRFENAAWTTAVPELLVFDGTFIAENVHSGDVVDVQQKRNLYRVIVGKEGVDLALEEEKLAGESRDKGSGIRSAERALQTHLPGDTTLADFPGPSF